VKPFLLSPAAAQDLAEIDEGVKSFPVGPHVLFYYADEDSVGIARILDGSRDLATAFRMTSGAE
jgi:plasmid stabilization system protein ParE